MIALAVVVAVVVLLAGFLAWIDRRDRRRRRGLRKSTPGAISSAAREARSDARATDFLPIVQKDVSWTDYSRRNR